MSRQILRSLPLHRPPYLNRAYSTYRASATRNVRLPTIFGAVLAVAGLVGWRLTSSQRIALDAQQRPSHTSTQLSAHIDEKKGTAQLRTSAGTTEEMSSDSQPQGTSQLRQASSEQPPQLEEEESGEAGAFNPETGEINWDCPCLGGMAHGPCGLQFREAFSCFVFSEQEPKGIDCIDKFRLMQECFREHPDVYGEELAGDDEADEPPDSQSPPEPSVAPPTSSPTETNISELQSQSTSENRSSFAQ